ncbi:MAG: hypothetical protein KC483_03505 [Nitrosarchaeum sp.]|nr:hypothetical protein [Nitrosarchaeum sp.]
MKNICLVGCGNVGSRHLQAIAKLPFPVDVEIVEPNQDSQELGKKRLSEIEQNRDNKFSWLARIDDLRCRPDLTIVATTATGRAEILCRLADIGHSRFLIEKMACQSDEEYSMIVDKFHQRKAKGWINTNPRCFASYQKLREYFEGSKNIHFAVTASNVSALGTNTVHYMDLFSYFTDDYNIMLNGDLLIDMVFPNKRGSHLMEFAGTITGKTRDDSTMVLTFLPSEKLHTIVNIVGNDKHVMIDETNQKAIDMVNGNEIRFAYEHASTLTTRISQDILEKDDCGLSTLEDSQGLHKEIFRMFNLHVSKVTGKNVELCPIT